MPSEPIALAGSARSLTNAFNGKAHALRFVAFLSPT